MTRSTAIDSLGIGVFDGMHIAHQAISDLSSVLLTFYPHPDIVLGKSTELKYLTTPEEWSLFPVEHQTLRFDVEMAKLEPQVFLDEIILGLFSPKQIVVGYDFRFGSKKKGDVTFLKEWGGNHSINVVVVPQQKVEGEVVSSSKIRTCLLGGDVATAVKYLGHSYPIMGTVVHGEGRGRELGFPTANLKVPALKLVPARGVYGATVLYRDVSYAAMVYIGNKPTFGGGDNSVEVFIVDFDKDLYSQVLTVQLETRVRGESKFESREALVAQIYRDIDSFVSSRRT